MRGAAPSATATRCSSTTTTAHEYTPLAHLRDEQGTFEICDSPLSEAGVLGFEYGYSLDMPDGLMIWEAQFGDFVNARAGDHRPVPVSSEAKWNRVSGLVMLLPHGIEGQGPEHSSARLERFLNMCVNDNIQVCNLTTPAQYFQLLRRQVLRPYRKPLIVMSPEEPAAATRRRRRRWPSSPTGASSTSSPTTERSDPKQVKRVLLCTGKVYYDLAAAREERELTTTSRSCASSSSIRLRTGRVCSRCCRCTRRARRSSGCRRSRGTWAPGTT